MEASVESSGPCRNCKRLGFYIQQLQETLASRNKELDLLLRVWCTGGCEGGVGRWSGEELSLEDVEYIENWASRARSYYNNQESRKVRAGE